MTWIFVVAGLLALIPAVNTLANIFQLREPELCSQTSRVAILIPARNEEATIGECLDAALSSIGVPIDVIVLDDGSTDDTKKIVEQRAMLDNRLKILVAPPLPLGMKGKPHACQFLSTMTTSPFLLFIDADVRLAPTAAARLVPPAGIDLISAVPRQLVKGVVETSVVPMINCIIFGYLPVALMRRRRQESLAAACGQVMMVRAAAYRQCGGHGAVAGFMHDGMQLAKLFRRSGFSTDLVDGTSLAQCRMYDGARAVFQGFTKNATEGMARPFALPVWTLLLVGGHLLPLALTTFVIAAGTYWSAASVIAVGLTALLVIARVFQALKCREPWQAVALHPLGIVLTLAIQWRALYRCARGDTVEWRGRCYAPGI